MATVEALQIATIAFDPFECHCYTGSPLGQNLGCVRRSHGGNSARSRPLMLYLSGPYSGDHWIFIPLGRGNCHKHGFFGVPGTSRERVGVVVRGTLTGRRMTGNSSPTFRRPSKKRFATKPSEDSGSRSRVVCCSEDWSVRTSIVPAGIRLVELLI